MAIFQKGIEREDQLQEAHSFTTNQFLIACVIVA
jgi:hypothetical protein